MPGLRVGLVTAYPPAQGRLSEYGWHLAQALGRSSIVDAVYVFADRVDGARRIVDDKLTVEPCWTFDASDFPLRIAAAVRGKNLDAIWFNLHLASTGRRRISRALALAAPAALRLLRHQTLVTLHNLPDLTELPAAGVRASKVDLAAAGLAVRLIGRANLVATPLPEYARILRQRYGLRNSRFIHLGTPGLPSSSNSAHNPHALLAFGRFGSYKRLEGVLDAMTTLNERGHPAHLHIAGSDSVYSPGYLAGLQHAYGALPNVTFHGYVPEQQVPELFGHCVAAVMPYRTITGASSVAMQAAMYGCAILAADIPGLRQMAELGLQLSFVDFNHPKALAERIADFLASPDTFADQVQANLRACRQFRMDDVVAEYLQEIERMRARKNYRGRITAEITSSVSS